MCEDAEQQVRTMILVVREDNLEQNEEMHTIIKIAVVPVLALFLIFYVFGVYKRK